MSQTSDSEYGVLSSFGVATRVAKQTAVYAVGLWATSAAGFILTPVYTRYLGPSDYGILEVLNRTGGVFLSFLKMGMVAAVLRFWHSYSEERERLRVVSSAVLLVLTTGLLSLIIVSFISQEISHLIFRNSNYSKLCLLAVAGGVLELWFLVPGALLRVRERVSIYTVVAVEKFGAALAFNLLFVVVLRMGVNGAVLANTLAVGVFSVALLLYTLRQCGLGVSFKALRQMLGYGIPLTVAAIPSLLVTTGDRYILLYARNSHEVGMYALATKFGMLLQLLIFEPFTFIYRVVVFKIASSQEAERIFGRLVTYLALVSAWIALGIALLAPWAVRIVAGAGFNSSVAMIPGVLLGSFLWGISPALEVGIYLKNKTWWKPLLVVLQAITALALYLLLIPKFGGVGAAWAYAGTEFVYAIGLPHQRPSSHRQWSFRIAYLSHNCWYKDWGHVTYRYESEDHR